MVIVEGRFAGGGGALGSGIAAILGGAPAAGGGTIGTGQVSVPGEQGFTGNEQPQGTPQQTEGVSE